MKKIKIAFVIDSINSVAGTEKQLIQTMNNLNEDKFDIKLICLRKPSAIFEVEKSSFEYIELDVPRLFSIKAMIKLLRFVLYLRKEKVDIIQTFFFDAMVFGVFSGKIAGVKTIISSRRDLGFWYTPRLLSVLKIVNRFTTRIVANSFAVKENVIKLEHIDGSKVDVIKNGLNMDLFANTASNSKLYKSLGIPETDKKVGIVANLNRNVKRVDVFIKSASEVQKKLRDVSFLIVGDGYLKGELEELKDRLGLDKKLIFLGYQNNIPLIIKNWDVGIISSDSEGFSNSILEYMASGVPVGATNIGGNSEVVDEGVNGFLIEPGDYNSMAEKICELLENKTKRSQMSENARNLMLNDYSWDKKIIEIESYYQNLMK